ncbi:peptidase inhibitor family I36 protein [Streptomyces sp. 4N509B]|uniref:peptidase inhibitor family I36 protein n=1 Tax=Streptomyces sp. 4N509B TaxID=3457413 RepID=UPI003FD4860F
MRRLLATALVALGTAATLGFAPNASAASAAPADAVEELRPAAAVEGRFWIFEWPEYTGNQKSYNGTDRYFANDEWDGTNTSVDNLTSSAQNLTNQWGTLYQFGNSSGGACSGEYFGLAPGYGVRDLGPFAFNNQASCIVMG